MSISNDLIIYKMFHANEVFDVMLETNAMGVEHVENWLHDYKFDHINYVVFGARIMITENINISKGVVNGTFVIVTSIRFSNNKIITSVIIKIICTNIQIILKRQTLRHEYTFEKSKVIIDIKNSFASGLIYVTLLRVTNRSNLLICKTFIPTNFLCSYQN